MESRSSEPHTLASVSDSKLFAELSRVYSRRLVNFVLGEQQLSEQLADSLRKAIENSGYSQAEIAVETGIDAGILSRFMRGERSLTLETAGKIAELLKLSLKPTKATKKK